MRAPAARLFQSREGIFGRIPTEYDQILRIRKAVEPYTNLWSTAKEWRSSYEAWTMGSFLAIDAEALEADVERYLNLAPCRGVPEMHELEASLGSTSCAFR